MNMKKEYTNPKMEIYPDFPETDILTASPPTLGGNETPLIFY